MKQLIVLSALVLLLASCGNNDKKVASTDAASTTGTVPAAADAENLTTVQWLDSAQNFGKVIDGEKVIITFHFKNTGTKPLIISSVQASCGCTVPSKPEEPIAPGAEGKITAEFNSEGRVGKANKNLTVTANTKEGVTNLFFEGEVLPKK
ncbi:DUF1573 domain-containing protein [Lacibacter luteus]|uniref:DUF1573 domain-containing protein n=1 Tax=Lacibacter luteus TaxID=2508719 RepID=A0A4Q1CDG2_9BACT|nr:DUF1573 domain-containing protein [Lacibacter luteus]RXK57595.1 DUF1573 domain-containing protein [Lacibacter luteus]